MTTTIERPAERSGTFAIAGDLPVHRLGFGSMRLTGPGVWGEPDDPEEAVRVLRRAIELGVNFIDTADSYGPYVAEESIRRALHPYPAGLVIATKAGFVRPGPDVWKPVGRPEYLRQEVEMSLRRLALERIDVLQLHRIDRQVPLADQVGELALMQKEGKIRHIGLSEVSIEQLQQAQKIATIVSVQNHFNLTFRKAEPLLDYVATRDIAFIPWFPLAKGSLAHQDSPLQQLARRLGATPSQLALAWLLHRSPVMLPIPGTSRVAHLEENMAAAALELSDADMAVLTQTTH